MKILYISNYKNNGGWSTAAESHIKLLMHNHDVVAPHINLGSGLRDVSLGSNNLENIDICIQQVLPNFAIADRRFKKNIIVYFSEASPLLPEWVRKINQFDCAVVSSLEMMKDAINSGVNIPIHIIPINIDVQRILDHKDKPFEDKLRKAYPGECIFYTFGDLNNRKNLEELLLAFYSNFYNKRVRLAIKLPVDNESATKYIDDISNKIFSALRIFKDHSKYRKPIVISGYASYEDMLDIHKMCDIYVTLSHSEAFSIPSIEAFLLDKLCIVPNHSAFREYLGSTLQIETNDAIPCMEMSAPDGLHTGCQYWNDLSFSSILYQLNTAYDIWLTKKHNNNISNLVKKLDLNKIQKLWEDVLLS